MNKTKETVKAPVVETPPAASSPTVAPVSPAPAAAQTPLADTKVLAADGAASATTTGADPGVTGTSSSAALQPEAEKPKVEDTDPKPVTFTAEDHAHAAQMREAKVHEQQLLHLRRQHAAVEQLCKKVEKLELELAALKKN